MTSQLVGRYKHLVIEDLNVKGMMQGSTPKAQADAAMGAIRRKLEYKAPWHHCRLGLAHRPYPSSKTCSWSGEIIPNLVGRQVVSGPDGVRVNRDINGARRILLRALGDTPALREVAQVHIDDCATGIVSVS